MFLPAAKLTKRQKKGIAFRQRKHSKTSKDEAEGIISNLEDEINVPGLEDQALVVGTQGLQGNRVSAEALVGKRKESTEGDETEARLGVAARKKRKVGEEAKGDKLNLKRRKGPDGNPLDDMKQPEGDYLQDEAEVGREGDKTKQRFILFLGNLKYTTTTEAIQAHFATCVPPPTVRLLTPRSSTKSPTKTVMKSKGCAFLEFRHRGALQQGLKLHHSELDGRQINVELTAGGGGKGLPRMEKLKARNKGLEAQRRKRQDPNAQCSTQRFSATSGKEQSHVQKRTWTVGDAEEDETHRGGRKHRKGSRKRRPLAKEFRTGVNAIPVG